MARAQILVADRDPGFARGLAANLESLGYAITEVVSSPEEALKKVEEKQPDLVLLDLGLLRDGKKKASQDLRKRIPNLVYLVGEEDPQTLERAKITHSFDYLRKACDSRELETIIDMALYRRQLAEEAKRDREEQKQARRKWQQRDEKQTAKIGKITAKLESETERHQRLEEGLQAERQKLYAVLDTLPVYVVLLAQDYSVPFANREFIKRFSAPEGRKCYDFLFGRTSPCPDCETFKALQTNAPHEWERTGPDGRDYQIYDFPFPDIDGSTLILEMGMDVTVLKEKEAQIQKMAAALRRSYEELEARVQDRTQELSQSNAALQNEIAERLWSEKKLRDSEERYRLLVDLSPDAIAVQSQGRFLFINPAGAQLFGAADPREMVGKAVPDVIHPDYRQFVSEHICRVNGEGAQTDLQEIKILRRDGRVVDVEASGVGIDYQGQPAVQVMMRDITRRKEMEKKLEHQASFPRLNPNPVLEADAAGNITYANAASLNALEKLGLKNRVKAFLPPDLAEIMKAAAKTGETLFYREVKIKDAFFVESISFPKEFEVIRIYARDITRQKLAEIELQDLLAKLQVSEEELQATVEELQVQAEELQAQAEELQITNQDLNEANAALRESEARFKAIFEGAASGVALKDLEGRYFQANDAFLEMLGYAPAELAGKTFVDITHPGDAQQDQDAYLELMSGGREHCHLEKRYLRKDGALLWANNSVSLVRDDQGEPCFFVSMVEDITARKAAEEALRESREDLNRAQAVAHTGSWRLDVRKNELLWSDENHRIFGIPRGTPLTYEAFLAIVHPEDRAYVEREWIAALRGEPYDIEHRIVVGDTVKWVRERAELEFDPQGMLLGGFGTTQDITARKWGEETLQASRNFLEIANRHNRMAPLLQDYAAAIKEHTGCEAVAIRILDEEGKIPYQAHQGFSQEFIACESPLSIHSDQCLCINVIKGATDPELPCYTEGSSCYINRFSHVLDTSPPGQLGETRNVCHRFGYESVALIPIVFGEEILGLIHLADCRENMAPRSLVERLERIGLQLGTAINRVRAEEERQRLIGEVETERARLQAVIESAPEAIVVVDAGGNILMTNPAADRLYAHPDGCVRDAPSCALFQFCHPDGSICIPGNQPLLRSAKEGETHRNVEMVLAWPDGPRRDLLVNTAPIMDQQGGSSGAVGLFQDITERKQTEEKIRKLNVELGDRIREVSERTLELEAANKELEAFSYSVSHDLRTPLRAIEGFARMLREDYAPKLDGEGLRLLGVIRSNTQIMGDLIDDLLALSRLGRQEIRAQEIDLEGLVASVFGDLQAQEPARQLELILNPLPPAFGDRTLINQVLANLLGNAVKFTKPREKAIIEVSGWTEGKENIYSIKDNGVGFDMRYVAKIFGVFQRLHRREDFEGMGVGLAIVERIINRHGGRVWATGKVGQGAEFYFALPVKGESVE